MNYVTLVNRTSKTLTGQWDGKQHSFPPGYRGTHPEMQALKFRDQNPLMGSENYYSGDREYLMGIVENGDPLEPIEQSAATERWDRTAIVLPPGSKFVEIPGRGYNPISDRSKPLPAALAAMESIEPTPGSPDTETVSIQDGIGLDSL